MRRQRSTKLNIAQTCGSPSHYRAANSDPSTEALLLVSSAQRQRKKLPDILIPWLKRNMVVAVFLDHMKEAQHEDEARAEGELHISGAEARHLNIKRWRGGGRERNKVEVHRRLHVCCRRSAPILSEFPTRGFLHLIVTLDCNAVDYLTN